MIYELETLSATLFEEQLSYLLNNFGIKAKLYKKKSSEYDDYYGPHYVGDIPPLSEYDKKDILDTVILVTSNPKAIYDDVVADATEISPVYALDENIGIGDTLEVIRSDDRTRKFKVIAVEGVGITNVSVKSLKIAAVGD